jgi:hypothetical protein
MWMKSETFVLARPVHAQFVVSLQELRWELSSHRPIVMLYLDLYGRCFIGSSFFQSNSRKGSILPRGSSADPFEAVFSPTGPLRLP